MMAMCYTLNHLILEEIRPFDWIMLAVEVLVLILIAVEIFIFTGPEWWHGIQAKKKAAKLIPFLAQGEALRNLISKSPNQDQNQHRENILKWDKETQDFLAAIAPRALSAYMHIVRLQANDSAVLSANGQLHPVHGLFADAYRVLQSRLENLQKIIETPVLYF